MDAHRINRDTVAALVALVLAVPLGALAWTSHRAAADGTVTLPAGQEGEIACMVELTDADMADLQADEHALAAHLDGLGIEHTYEELAFTGLRFVEWDVDDEAANQAVADFWAERFPLSPEDVALLNEEADGLAAHLDAAGIAYTVETAPDGVREVVWDDEAAAAEAAVDEYHALTPEEIAELNAEADALAAHLTTAGIEHTITTDPDGSRWVEWDDEDEAANIAVDDFYATVVPGADDSGIEDIEDEELEELPCEG